MKKFLSLAFVAAFSAAPLAACDFHDGAKKSDTKAEMKTERKAPVRAAKSTKSTKPVAQAKGDSKKI
jgi:hypothetical protein